jgi:hypothetical protein
LYGHVVAMTAKDFYFQANENLELATWSAELMLEDLQLSWAAFTQAMYLFVLMLLSKATDA